MLTATAPELPAMSIDRQRVEIGIIGIQRSGTNFVSELLRQNFDIDANQSNVWKHAFADEVESFDTSLHFLLVVRHPITWLQSCLIHTPRDLIERRADYFSSASDSVESFARLYHKFYSEWLDRTDGNEVVLCRYEDLLQGGLAKLCKALGLEAQQERKDIVPSKVPMSVSFSDADRAAYLRLECSLDEGLAADFWGRLGDLPERLGYKIADVAFGAKHSVRTLAYRLQSDPLAIDDEAFSALLREAPIRFADDGPVLHRLATEANRRLGAISSIDLGARAVLAYDREFESLGERSTSTTNQAEAIDELIAALSKLKEDRLDRTVAYHRHALQDPDLSTKEYANSAFYISDCENRRGRLEAAIEAARMAAEPPNRPGGSVHVQSPWIFHHLAHLLEKSGALQEAAVNFARAATADPNDHRHAYSLSRVQLLLGEFEAAADNAASAAAQNPGDMEMRLHAAWCAHQQAASLMAKGHLDASLTAIERALSWQPDSAAHHYLRAEILDRKSDLVNAIASARHACTCSDPVGWHFHFLGHLLRLANDGTAARAAFETAQLMEPDNEHHKRALEALRLDDATSAELQSPPEVT